MNYQGTSSSSSSGEMSDDYRIKRIKFSEKEDQLLADLVSKCGTKNWVYVSTHMSGRTPRQCRDRWNHYLAPQTNTASWTSAEDKIIIEKVKELGKQWSKIAALFKGRTGIAVRNRCCKLSRQKNADPFLKKVLYEEGKKKVRADIVDANDIIEEITVEEFNTTIQKAAMSLNNTPSSSSSSSIDSSPKNNYEQKNYIYCNTPTTTTTSSFNNTMFSSNSLASSPNASFPPIMKYGNNDDGISFNNMINYNEPVKMKNKSCLNDVKLPSCSYLLKLSSSMSTSGDATKLCPLFGGTNYVSLQNFDLDMLLHSQPPLNIPAPPVVLK